MVRVAKILKRNLPNLLTSIHDPVTSATAEGLSRIIEAPSNGTRLFSLAAPGTRFLFSRILFFSGRLGFRR